MSRTQSNATTCPILTGKLNKGVKRIHVNQHAIKRNIKCGTDEPVITVKQSKGNTYGHEVLIYDKNGELAARLMQPLDKKLSCGARVWIETSNPIVVVNRNEKNKSIRQKMANKTMIN